MCDIAWYNKFLTLNPDAQRRRDAIVKFAETQGEQARLYLRRMFPRFWFEVDFIAPGTIGPTLRLSEIDERRILGGMFDALSSQVAPSKVFDRGTPETAKIPQGTQHV